MNIQVRYQSKSGNTKKIAEAIAQGAGVSAKSIEEPISNKTDILFLGGAVYAAGVDKTLKEFILTLHGENVEKVVVFSTAGIIESAFAQMKKLLEQQGLTVSTEEYHCRGSFLMFHKNHPNESDSVNARIFAETIVKNS